MLPFGGAAPVMALVTTRDVDEGEELLLSYGHSYWTGTSAAHAPSELGPSPAGGGGGGAPLRSFSPAVRRAAAAVWGDGLAQGIAGEPARLACRPSVVASSACLATAAAARPRSVSVAGTGCRQTSARGRI